jgi:hypothetical protein
MLRDFVDMLRKVILFDKTDKSKLTLPLTLPHMKEGRSFGTLPYMTEGRSFGTLSHMTEGRSFETLPYMTEGRSFGFISFLCFHEEQQLN